MAQAPKAVAEGTLAKTPLAHVLVSLATRHMTGTLAVWPDPSADGSQPRGQDRIRFDRGMAVAMRPLEQAPSMDRALGSLFARTRAPYAFYEADLVGAGDGVLTGRVDPLALVARAVRGPAGRGKVVQRVLERLGDAPLELSANAPLDRFELEPEERELVERLSMPATVSQLLSEWSDQELAHRVLYLLAITRSVTATGAGARPSALSQTGMPAVSSPPPQQPPAGSPAPSRSGSRPVPEGRSRSSRAPAATRPEPPPQAPSHLPAELGRRWTEIAARAEELEEQNFFDMLGVERSDGAQAVRDAYLEQVKRWHPDRLPTELLPLKPWVERIFHYVTEARDTLSDPEARAAYLKSVQGGGGTPASERKVNAIVGSAIEFQKVEVLARRKNWDEALEVLDEVLELNPDEADFHAMRAWVLFQKHGADESSPIRDMLHAVDRSLELDAECVRAHYTKGLILKRLGKQREALGHFRKVTELNPRHIEAAREVRLAEMRSRSSSRPAAPEGRPSFLSKLFGGKKK